MTIKPADAKKMLDLLRELNVLDQIAEGISGVDIDDPEEDADGYAGPARVVEYLKVLADGADPHSEFAAKLGRKYIHNVDEITEDTQLADGLRAEPVDGGGFQILPEIEDADEDEEIEDSESEIDYPVMIGITEDGEVHVEFDPPIPADDTDDDVELSTAQGLVLTMFNLETDDLPDGEIEDLALMFDPQQGENGEFVILEDSEEEA